ncbi:MAG: hypothetical protein GXY55_05175 [Phycisphaerae bacterium]|nr:hypothetical protein [Phycisphaerae bacterium]
MRVAILLTGLAAMLPAPLVWAQASTLEGACTVVLPPDTGFVLDYALDPPGQSDLRQGQRLRPATGVSTITGNTALIYLAAGEPQSPTAQASVYLDADSQLRLAGEDVRHRQITVQRGVALIRYQASDGEPVAIVAGGGWVRLHGGVLRVAVTDNRVEWTFMSAGSAVRFDGHAPAGEIKAVEGGQSLTPAPLSSEAAALIAALHSGMGLDAPADWLGRAERGDLTPNDPEGELLGTFEVPEVRAAAVAKPSAQVATVSAAAANVLPPLSSVSASQPPQRVSGVQALLASENPASVVVGARLGRARVVGVPEPSNLLFNREVRPPLNLSPGR